MGVSEPSVWRAKVTPYREFYTGYELQAILILMLCVGMQIVSNFRIVFVLNSAPWVKLTLATQVLQG